jgi:hypothetical protein
VTSVNADTAAGPGRIVLSADQAADIAAVLGLVEDRLPGADEFVDELARFDPAARAVGAGPIIDALDDAEVTTPARLLRADRGGGQR